MPSWGTLRSEVGWAASGSSLPSFSWEPSLRLFLLRNWRGCSSHDLGLSLALRPLDQQRLFGSFCGPPDGRGTHAHAGKARASASPSCSRQCADRTPSQALHLARVRCFPPERMLTAHPGRIPASNALSAGSVVSVSITSSSSTSVTCAVCCHRIFIIITRPGRTSRSTRIVPTPSQ
jgi:hypothetical protein